MCNLYDIGPARKKRGDLWEDAVAGVIGRLSHPFGRRKTDTAPVITWKEGGASAELMRWGFERPYNPAVNNARLEKLDGPWSEPWRERRRCLIPLSTWYEWSGPTGAKQTFAFESVEGTWLWAAGLWEAGAVGCAFTMLTRPAEPDLSLVHDRMPALLNPAHFEAFLTRENPRGFPEADILPLSVFRCHNPLLRASTHRGPEPIEMLPGF